MNVTAIIPVRAGSRRLKNKNLASFGGSNLLSFKIEQLKNVKEISKIVVSSDSDEMLRIAQEHDVSTHKRELKYCDEISVPFGEVVKHICENVAGDIILWATCTSPLVNSEMYSEALEKYFEAEKSGFDSLVSMEEVKRYIWDKNGPINYELGLKHLPSQELPPLYFVTDGILIAPKNKMIEWNYFHGPNPYRFVISKKASVDIDDELDLATAKAWLNF